MGQKWYNTFKWQRRDEARSAALLDSYAMSRMGAVNKRTISEASGQHGDFLRMKHVLWVMYDIWEKFYGMRWEYGGVEVDARKYVPKLLSDQ